MTRSTFIEKTKAYTNASNRLTPYLFAAAVTFFTIMFWPGLHFDEHGWRSLTWYHMWNLGGVLYVSVLLTVVFKMQKYALNIYGLRCEACRGGLTGASGNYALSTGCCRHCGHRVLEDG